MKILDSIKRQKKTSIILVAAIILVLYCICFGPIEALACRGYAMGTEPSIWLAERYFEVSSRLNYPHYKMAAHSRWYFKYYTAWFRLGAGKPFGLTYEQYNEGVSLFGLYGTSVSWGAIAPSDFSCTGTVHGHCDESPTPSPVPPDPSKEPSK